MSVAPMQWHSSSAATFVQHRKYAPETPQKLKSFIRGPHAPRASDPCSAGLCLVDLDLIHGD